MADLKKMTVQRLRDLARKVIGPGYSRLKTKGELVGALAAADVEPAGKKAAAKPGSRAAAAKAAPVRPAPKATKAAPEKVAKPAPEKVAKAAPEKVARPAPGKAAKPAPAKVAKLSTDKAPKPAPGKVAPRAAGKKGAVERAATAVAEAVGAALGAATGVNSGVKKVRAAAAARKKAPAKAGAKPGARARGSAAAGGPDPEGFFVARVRGEEALRGAPHPLSEEAAAADDAAGAPIDGEGLGELPWGYGDDAFVAIPRDPRTLFLYWDLDSATVTRAFGGLDHPRAQLWLFARTAGPAQGWERVRVLEFALESRGYYVHDLEPGRAYRAEIHVIDRRGADRVLKAPSNEVGLPSIGPSPIVDDRFIRIPWELPLGNLLGAGRKGGAFSEEVRAVLARLSDWSRFAGKGVWGSAGGMGGRPFSPTSGPGAVAAGGPSGGPGAPVPSSPAPSSPAGPYGPRDE